MRLKERLEKVKDFEGYWQGMITMFKDYLTKNNVDLEKEIIDEELKKLIDDFAKSLNSDSEEYKERLASSLFVLLKEGLITGTTRSRNPNYSTEDLLKMLNYIKDKPENVKVIFEESILSGLKHRIENSNMENKTQILYVIEEVKDLNKLLELDIKLIEKYPDDNALKLSHEGLLARKDELVKELKELISEEVSL